MWMDCCEQLAIFFENLRFPVPLLTLHADEKIQITSQNFLGYLKDSFPSAAIYTACLGRKTKQKKNYSFLSDLHNNPYEITRSIRL